MNEINDKLDRIVEQITEIKVSQARTEVIMEHHIKRTDLSEENLELLREEFKPIKAHVQFINYLAKCLTIIGSIMLFMSELGLWQKFLSLLR